MERPSDVDIVVHACLGKNHALANCAFAVGKYDENISVRMYARNICIHQFENIIFRPILPSDKHS